MGRRNGTLVAEDDPGFTAFWKCYPWKAAKKDARKAWVQVQAGERLEVLLAALAWQVPLWATQGYGMPMPATYLRGERWMDEPPPDRRVADRRVGERRRPAWAQGETG